MKAPPDRSAQVAAIILGTRPLGEADLLVVVMTPEHGKLRAAARNARRSRKRFAGGLPGGALGEATISRGRGALWRLDSFRAVREMSGLGRDLTRFAYAAYLCELTDVLVCEPQPDPRLFAALTDALTAVVDGHTDPGVLRRYELRLLDALGLLPTLTQCCVCGEPVAAADPHQVHFDAGRGGALCLLHAGDAPRTPAEVLRLCAALRGPQGPTAATKLAAAPPGIRRAVRDLAAGLVRSQLRKPLRSLEFFAKLEPSR